MKKLLCIILAICMLMTAAALTACDGEGEHDHEHGEPSGEVSGDTSGDISGEVSGEGQGGLDANPPSVKLDKTYNLKTSDGVYDITLNPDASAVMVITNGEQKYNIELGNSFYFEDEAKTKLVVVALLRSLKLYAFDVDLQTGSATFNAERAEKLQDEISDRVADMSFDPLSSVENSSCKVTQNGELIFEMSIELKDGIFTFKQSYGASDSAIITGTATQSEGNTILVDGNISGNMGELQISRDGVIELAYILNVRYAEIVKVKCKSHDGLPEELIDKSYAYHTECACICELCGERVTYPMSEVNGCYACNYCSKPSHNYDEAGKCKKCGYLHEHLWFDEKCDYCGAECEHKELDGCRCKDCDTTVHTFGEKCTCTVCGYSDHSIDYSVSCACKKCGEYRHSFFKGKCNDCGAPCEHTGIEDCYCDVCYAEVHDVDDTCVCRRCKGEYHDLRDPETGERVRCTCAKCGKVLMCDFWDGPTCSYCGKECPHDNMSWDCYCYTCRTYFHTPDSTCRCTKCYRSELHTYPTDTDGNRTSCVCTVCKQTNGHNYDGMGHCHICGINCTHPSFDGCACTVCRAYINHDFVNCVCSRCRYEDHRYPVDENGRLIGCICVVCGYENEHRYVLPFGGVPSCEYCGKACEHKNVRPDCYCPDCGYWDCHKLDANCVCTTCGGTYHDLNDEYGNRAVCVCRKCGKTEHYYVIAGTCFICQYNCTHEGKVVDCACTECGKDVHNWDATGTECTVCKKKRN